VKELPDDLIAAVRGGEGAKVGSALAGDLDLVAATDADGMTLLHWAIAAAQPAVLAGLLACPDAPLDAPQASYGRTPLHMAAIKGAVEPIRMLVDAGANVFVTDKHGLRPLDVAQTQSAIAALRGPTLYPDRALKQAILVGAVLCVRRLLAACPDLLAASDAGGRSLLHWAVSARNPAMVEALIAAGAPIDKTDRSGNTPLHEAARQGNIHLTLVLLSAGAAPCLADNQGITPLHLAAGHGDAVGTLSFPPPDGLTPACPAAPKTETQCAFDFATPAASPPPSLPAPGPSRDDEAVAAALLESGADVNARARGGVTALHLAADAGDAGLVTLLLTRGAAVDPLLSLWQATPAHLAVAREHGHIVSLLQQAGADLAARDSYGRSVMEIHRGLLQRG